MAGLPWYAMWSNFSGHPKTEKLCARLRDDNAGMYVIRLFEHCSEHALDGRIAAESIERHAGWIRRRRGALIDALTASGFIEKDGDHFILHGWEERNGARIRQWERDRAKRHNTPSNSDTNPPGNPVSGPLETPRGSQGQDRDKDRSHDRSYQPATNGSGVTDDPGWLGELQDFRGKLATRLGVGALGVGRDPEAVVGFFREQLAAVGEESLLVECCDLAARSRNGPPANLAWFVGWLKRLPTPQPLVAGGLS